MNYLRKVLIRKFLDIYEENYKILLRVVKGGLYKWGAYYTVE